MKIHTQFKQDVLEEIKEFLDKNFTTVDSIPKPIADEAKKLASYTRKSSNATQLRTYVVDYIALASPFWRKLAPFTHFNKLISHLEKVVNLPQYSPQSIQISQITSVHEHYLEKQKELIEPLHIKIYSLQSSCQILQKTVASLREENVRLRIENDFFTQEIIALHTKFNNNTSPIRQNEPPCKTEDQKTILREQAPESTGILVSAP